MGSIGPKIKYKKFNLPHIGGTKIMGQIEVGWRHPYIGPLFCMHENACACSLTGTYILHNGTRRFKLFKY